jgi:hypothetical protein
LKSKHVIRDSKPIPSLKIRWELTIGEKFVLHIVMRAIGL